MVSSVLSQSLIVLIVCGLSVCAATREAFHVNFLRYHNPQGVDHKNDSCEGETGHLPCEFFFKIAFQDAGGEELKNFTSNVFHNNTVSFDCRLSKAVSNPFVMNVSSSQQPLRYRIEVWEHDDQEGGDDFMETLSGTVRVSVNDKWTTINATRNKTAPSFLEFKIRTESLPSVGDVEDRGTAGGDGQRRSECRERPLLIALVVVLLVLVLCVLQQALVLIRMRRKPGTWPPASARREDGEGEEGSAAQQQESACDRSSEVAQAEGDDADHVYAVVTKPPRTQDVVYAELSFT